MRMIGQGRRLLMVGVVFLGVTAGLGGGGTAFAAPAEDSVKPGYGGAVRLQAGVELSGPVDAPQKEGVAKVAPSTNQAAQYRKYTTWYGPLTVKPNEWWEAWVYCPSGMVATGGGEYNSSAGGVMLHSTYALDGGTGWKVTVSSTVDATFTVYAVCFGGLSEYRHVIDKAVVPPGQPMERRADCFTSQVLGGGGSTDTFYSRIGALYRTDVYPWWRFVMTNLDAVPRTINTQGICGNGLNNYQKVYGPATMLRDGEITGTAVVTCPPGTWVVSGGGYTSGWGGITDSYPEGNDKWRVFFRNDRMDRGFNGSANAICGT